MVRLENWSVIHVCGPYTDPEDITMRLAGNADGKHIVTSEIIGSEGRIVHCLSSSYLLGTPAKAYVTWLAALGQVLDESQPVRIP